MKKPTREKNEQPSYTYNFGTSEQPLKCMACRNQRRRGGNGITVNENQGH